MANASHEIIRKFRKGDGGDLTEALTDLPFRISAEVAEHAWPYLGKGRGGARGRADMPMRHSEKR